MSSPLKKCFRTVEGIGTAERMNVGLSPVGLLADLLEYSRISSQQEDSGNVQPRYPTRAVMQFGGHLGSHASSRGQQGHAGFWWGGGWAAPVQVSSL